MPVPPLPPILDDVAFLELIGGRAAYDIADERDYALSRLTWLNCAVGDGRPNWVLKGGFAIRHLYGGARLSADADLSPLSAKMAGGPEVLLPPEMTKQPFRLPRSGKSERWIISYPLRLGGAEDKGIWCDLNTGRPVLILPVDKEDFVSPWFPTFKVYAAAFDEIVAEKVVGLLTYAYGDVDRIKDAYDLWHLFSKGYGSRLDRDRLVRVLRRHYVAKGVRCPTFGLSGHIKAVMDSASQEDWEAFVEGVLRPPRPGMLAKVVTDLPRQATEYLP